MTGRIGRVGLEQGSGPHTLVGVVGMTTPGRGEFES